jgi:hypothetical protein
MHLSSRVKGTMMAIDYRVAYCVQRGLPVERPDLEGIATMNGIAKPDADALIISWHITRAMAVCTRPRLQRI